MYYFLQGNLNFSEYRINLLKKTFSTRISPLFFFFLNIRKNRKKEENKTLSRLKANNSMFGSHPTVNHNQKKMKILC